MKNKLFCMTALILSWSYLKGISCTPGTIYRPVSLPTADSLPLVTDLYASLESYHLQQLAAELAAFSEKVHPQWLNYVPSVGIGYTPAGDPRPTVSFSLAQVISARNRKSDIKAQRQAIRETRALQLETEKLQLRNLLLQHEADVQQLDFISRLFDIDAELFHFYEAQAAAAELAPSELLKRKKDFLRSEQEIRAQERAIMLLEFKILEAAHWPERGH
jgi:hypothetical protein